MFFFKELAHRLAQMTSLKSVGQSHRLRILLEGLNVLAKGCLEAGFPPWGGISFKVFDWLNEAAALWKANFNTQVHWFMC